MWHAIATTYTSKVSCVAQYLTLWIDGFLSKQKDVFQKIRGLQDASLQFFALAVR